jgi:hypothetical protein
MTSKEEALKIFNRMYTKKEIKENSLDLRCVKEKGKYYIFDDHSNPFFQKGHKSAQAAWKATVETLKDLEKDIKERKKKAKKKKKLEYNIGDVVGIATDAMYEFEITGVYESMGVYTAKCVMSYHDTIKVGDEYTVEPKQICVKLGENGKKWPV